MNKEVIKVVIPMFDLAELEAFDNNIHSIVEEYSKLMFKEKDQILTQRIIMKQEEEIERLNNIINELEKWLKDYINLFKEPDIYEEQTLEDLKEVLDKLQELKGSDKE